MQIIVEVPGDIARHTDPGREVLEAVALQAYREEKLSTAELRRLLGYRTRLQVHAFLKAHGVPLQYGLTFWRATDKLAMQSGRRTRHDRSLSMNSRPGGNLRSGNCLYRDPWYFAQGRNWI